MSAEITLILTLSLLIWTSPYLAKFLRLPTPPVEILMGALLSFFGWIHTNVYFDLIAEVGFLYLMFLAGMEVDLKQLASTSGTLLRQSILFVFTLGVLALLSGVLFGFHPIVIVSLPLISIGMLASLSRTHSGKDRWLEMAFIVGVLGEIASITALTVLDAASQVGLGWELLFKLGLLLLFIASIYVVYHALHLLFWWFPELKKKLMPSLDTADQDVRLSMALFFILVAMMLLLDLELALGAFIAGVAIRSFFRHEKRLEEKLSSLGFGLLIPLFFLHIGASFHLPSLLIPGVVSGALLIVAVTFSIRILASLSLIRISGALDAVSVAIALSMPLTLLIAVATIGYTTNTISLLTYYQLILASLIEVILSMSALKGLQLIRIKMRQKAWREKRLNRP